MDLSQVKGNLCKYILLCKLCRAPEGSLVDLELPLNLTGDVDHRNYSSPFPSPAFSQQKTSPFLDFVHVTAMRFNQLPRVKNPRYLQVSALQTPIYLGSMKPRRTCHHDLSLQNGSHENGMKCKCREYIERACRRWLSIYEKDFTPPNLSSVNSHYAATHRLFSSRACWLRNCNKPNRCSQRRECHISFDVWTHV